MAICRVCANRMKEYCGLNKAPGDGELYCPNCDGVVQKEIPPETTERIENPYWPSPA